MCPYCLWYRTYAQAGATGRCCHPTHSRLPPARLLDEAGHPAAAASATQHTPTRVPLTHTPFAGSSSLRCAPCCAPSAMACGSEGEARSGNRSGVWAGRWATPQQMEQCSCGGADLAGKAACLTCVWGGGRRRRRQRPAQLPVGLDHKESNPPRLRAPVACVVTGVHLGSQAQQQLAAAGWQGGQQGDTEGQWRRLVGRGSLRIGSSRAPRQQSNSA